MGCDRVFSLSVCCRCCGFCCRWGCPVGRLCCGLVRLLPTTMMLMMLLLGIIDVIVTLGFDAKSIKNLKWFLLKQTAVAIHNNLTPSSFPLLLACLMIVVSGQSNLGSSTFFGIALRECSKSMVEKTNNYFYLFFPYLCVCVVTEWLVGKEREREPIKLHSHKLEVLLNGSI